MSRRTLASAVAAAVLLASASARAAETVRVLLMPVIVHSIENQDYLRSGLVDMLTARLEQTKGVQVLHAGAETPPSNDEAAARAAGVAAGAQFVLYGSFTRFGEGASLDLQCARVGAAQGADNAKQIFVQSATLGDLIPKIDELADRVARYVTGGSAPAVAAAPPTGGATRTEIDDLRRRVEALERAGASPKRPAEDRAAQSN